MSKDKKSNMTLYMLAKNFLPPFIQSDHAPLLGISTVNRASVQKRENMKGYRLASFVLLLAVFVLGGVVWRLSTTLNALGLPAAAAKSPVSHVDPTPQVIDLPKGQKFLTIMQPSEMNHLTWTYVTTSRPSGEFPRRIEVQQLYKEGSWTIQFYIQEH